MPEAPASPVASARRPRVMPTATAVAAAQAETSELLATHSMAAIPALVVSPWQPAVWAWEPAATMPPLAAQAADPRAAAADLFSALVAFFAMPGMIPALSGLARTLPALS